MGKRAAIYVRVSTDKQTVENQLRELRQIAVRRGWEVIEEYQDAGISGTKGRKDRPGLEFVRRVAPGLGIALSLMAALAFFLILWGNRQAKRILTSEAQATTAARTDPLTGLSNRVGLREDLARLLDEAKATNTTLGILSADIDQFKSINDAFGHAVGDRACRHRQTSASDAAAGRVAGAPSRRLLRHASAGNRGRRRG